MTATKAPPTVTWDRDESTQFVSVYHSPSRTHQHITYRLVQEHRTGTLTCQCPAFTFRGQCAHTRAVRSLWWRNFWQSCDADVLADAQRTYDAQSADGTLGDEGAVALDTLRAELADREEAA